MKIPTVHGLIDRRMLVNYRVDPDVLQEVLPPPFRPKRVHGWGMAGICLIRLKRIAPWFWPGWLGLSSENAAHRVAVEWTENGRVREGVYVRRRDTSLTMNVLAGGRIFPGVHHHAKFAVHETPDQFQIAIASDDAETQVCVRARLAPELPSDSAFGSLAAASAFFQGGSVGYSATSDATRFDGLELRCRQWTMEPLQVEEVRSSYFENESLFPKGSIAFDCALLMRGIRHEWHGLPDLACPCVAGT